ncbi:MAG: hypothetical protein N7Q72_05320, partial [Spiroplasma sp. Tabriz.8]|nr:hypothetical protein [Spiroplasma sp. Tabriz.8]
HFLFLASKGGQVWVNVKIFGPYLFSLYPIIIIIIIIIIFNVYLRFILIKIFRVSLHDLCYLIL